MERFKSLQQSYLQNADVVIYINPNEYQKNIKLDAKTVSFDYDVSKSAVDNLERAKTEFENRPTNAVKGIKEKQDFVPDARQFHNIL